MFLAITFPDLPHITAAALDIPDPGKLALPVGATHPPRILIVYGSLRPQSFSRKLALEAGRILRQFGAETRVFANQSSVAKAWQEFDESGRMKPSAFYDRIVDVMEELFKFTLMVRDRSDYLVDRYSERKGAVEARALAAAAAVVDPQPKRPLAVQEAPADWPRCGSFMGANGIGSAVRLAAIPLNR